MLDGDGEPGTSRTSIDSECFLQLLAAGPGDSRTQYPCRELDVPPKNRREMELSPCKFKEVREPGMARPPARWKENATAEEKGRERKEEKEEKEGRKRQREGGSTLNARTVR